MLDIERVKRPSGVIPTLSRARTAWVSFASHKFRQKMLAVDQEFRFGVYREVDNDVIELFKQKCRTLNKENTTTDTDELMMEAGKEIAATLN